MKKGKTKTSTDSAISPLSLPTSSPFLATFKVAKLPQSHPDPPTQSRIPLSLSVETDLSLSLSSGQDRNTRRRSIMKRPSKRKQKVIVPPAKREKFNDMHDDTSALGSGVLFKQPPPPRPPPQEDNSQLCVVRMDLTFCGL